MAHRRLPRFALEYLEAGAGDEAALAGNLAALRLRRLVPRALVDASDRDLGCTLFDEHLPLPLVIAPTGLNGVFRRKADSLLAAAAAGAGIPFTQSTMSNQRVAEVAAAAPRLRHWFQLYVINPPEITDHLIGEAEKSGCEALVITTDAQLYGKRNWAERDAIEPARLRMSTLLDAALHPRWLATTLAPYGTPRFQEFLPWLPSDKQGLFASAFWIRAHMDRSLDWDRVKRIRDRWPRRLLIKGILAPEDVARAVAIGADGVVLSNHGARQLASSVAPLDMVKPTRDAGGDGIALLVDGGIRCGEDIAKALALGADAVMVGRAPLYGLAAAGRDGVARAIEILRQELDLTLGLLGCPRARDLNPDFLA
jgi:(S)-mandelate dehydrogenase